MKNWNQKDWETYHAVLSAILPSVYKENKNLTAKDVIGAISFRIAVGVVESMRSFEKNGHFGIEEIPTGKTRPINFRNDADIPS